MQEVLDDLKGVITEPLFSGGESLLIPRPAGLRDSGISCTHAEGC